MKRYGFLASLIVAFVGANAVDANAQSDVSEDEAAGTFDEIIVTSRRREESIRDVPVAVNVFTEQLVRDMRIREIGDVLNYSPGTQFIGHSPDQQDIIIRGVGADIYGASAEASVVTVIDDAIVSRSWMRNGLIFDVNRVEVLRGPQGTTFGRNATAGVVHIVNNAPEFEQSSSVALDVGNYGLIEARGHFNAAISDNTALRLSAFYMERDGYSSHEVTNDPLDNKDILAVRAQLKSQISDQLDVLVRVNYSEDHMDVANPMEVFDPTMPVNFLGQLTYQALDTDIRSVQEYDWENEYFDRDMWDVGLDIGYDFGDVGLTFMSNYRHGRIDTLRGLWGTNVPALRQDSFEDADVFQTEVRLDNSASDSNVQWQAGVFYLTEDVMRREEKLIMLTTPFVAYQDFLQLNETDSFGVFGTVEYELASQTRISAGMRYSKDEKTYEVPFMSCGDTPNITGLNPIPGGTAPICGIAGLILDYPNDAFISGSNKEDWNDTNYRLTINHPFSESLNVYASYATGYKSGGFPNEPNAPAPEGFQPYNPETVDTFEIGAKGAFLDGALRFDVAIFDSSYDDRQAEAITPGGQNIVFNTASASIKGVEAVLNWSITERFSVLANISNLNHEDDETGEPLGDIRDWQAVTAFTYETPLNNGSILRFYFDARMRDDFLTNSDPQVVVPGDTVLGANVIWLSADDRMTIGIWGRNLTNEDDLHMRQAESALGDQGTQRAGAPRTYGVTFSYNWD